MIGVEGEVVQGSIEKVLHQKQLMTLTLQSQPKLIVDQFLYRIKFLPLLPKDYYLIPNKGTKNLFRPNRTCMLIIKMDLSMNLLKI